MGHSREAASVRSITRPLVDGAKLMTCEVTEEAREGQSRDIATALISDLAVAEKFQETLRGRFPKANLKPAQFRELASL